MNDPISSLEPVNPYAPPKASIAPGGVATPEDAERVRRELLTHETSIRGIGSLYLLGAFANGLGAVGVIAMAAFESSAETSPGLLGIGVVYGLLSWLLYYLGIGLRRLNAEVRTGVTILAVIGLLFIPIGTLINGYILYLIHCGRGKRVMTPEYQAIFAQTPHIKYRSPVWKFILIILIIAFAILGLLVLLF